MKKKKEWLRRYRKAAKLEKIKLDEVEQYRAAAEHITQVLSPVPGGAGDGQALPRSVERIADAMQAANAQVMECQRICKEILSVMSQTVDIQDYEILYLRYIGGKKWEQIAVKMDIDVSRVYRRHKRAVKALDIPGVPVNALFLEQSALFCTVFDERRTVLHCLTCDIIRLRKPQGAGQHPTPCGFCIARLRQGNTLPTNSLNVPAGQFMFWYPWHC